MRKLDICPATLVRYAIRRGLTPPEGDTAETYAAPAFQECSPFTSSSTLSSPWRASSTGYRGCIAGRAVAFAMAFVHRTQLYQSDLGASRQPTFGRLNFLPP